MWLLRLAGLAILYALFRYGGVLWVVILGGTVVLAALAVNRAVKPAVRPMVPALALHLTILVWSVLGLLALTDLVLLPFSLPFPVAVIHLAVVAPGKTAHSFSVGVNIAAAVCHLAIVVTGLTWLARRPSAGPLALLASYHVLCAVAGPFDLAHVRGILEYAGMYGEALAGLMLQSAVRALAIALTLTGLGAIHRMRSVPARD